jgi:hypothetical protein
MQCAPTRPSPTSPSRALAPPSRRLPDAHHSLPLRSLERPRRRQPSAAPAAPRPPIKGSILWTKPSPPLLPLFLLSTSTPSPPRLATGAAQFSRRSRGGPEIIADELEHHRRRHRYQRTRRRLQRRPASTPPLAGAPARRRPPCLAAPASPSPRRRRRTSAARSSSNPTARTIPYRFG